MFSPLFFCWSEWMFSLQTVRTNIVAANVKIAKVQLKHIKKSWVLKKKWLHGLQACQTCNGLDATLNNHIIDPTDESNDIFFWGQIQQKLENWNCDNKDISHWPILCVTNMLLWPKIDYHATSKAQYANERKWRCNFIVLT